MLAWFILGIGILARIIVHIPNFTPVIAIAIFGGLYLNNKKLAVWLPVILMAITDIFLGFHNIIIFTWGSLILIALANVKLSEKVSVKTILLSGFLSSVFFFVVTNFGVWLMTGMYSRDWAGFVNCYVMAVPFFKTSLFSTLLYVLVFSTSYEMLTKRLTLVYSKR